MTDVDIRLFAERLGSNKHFAAGSVVFHRGEPGDCMYVIQSGLIELLVGERIVEECGPNEAIGFMSMIDGAARSSTARVKSDAEVSIIDQRKFRFMVDEVPNFAIYIMGVMAKRIRGITQAL